MVFTSSIAVFLGVAVFVLAETFAVAPANEQVLLSSSTIANFSVGFSLQSSFGAAAVILEDQNGRLHTHTKVYRGDEEYLAVMARLSWPSSMHLAPPYRDMEDHFNDLPRRTLRNGRKKVGVPASHDVGVLASVLQQTKSQLESDLGISITEAIFTSAHLLALYQDDLTDVADHLGVKYLTPKRQFYPIFWETGAAYAGYGLGLCKHWRDEKRCTKEHSNLPDINLLSVHYSHHALTVAFVPIVVAAGAFEPDDFHLENFALGSGAIGDYSSPEEYWAGVKEALLWTIRAYPGMQGPHKIMMTGDMAHDEDFIKFMETTIEEHKGFLPPVISDRAETAAAIGAAEMMRRGHAPWGPGPY